MIRLFQFPPVWSLPSGSPFCVKVETYLRMVGLPYETVNDSDVRKAPKHKLPVIQDDSRKVADSGFIVEYLKATYGDPLDTRLSPAEKGVALAMRRLMEEHLYWCLLYVRWQIDAHWPAMREAFFSFLPALLRSTVANAARKQVQAELHGHGMGRHTPEEVYSLARADLDALAAFLADKPFFMGPSPTSLDACAYAFLSNALWGPPGTPIQQHARSLAAVRTYCERMKDRYYAS